MCELLDTDWSAGHGLTQTGLVVSDLVCRVHVRLIIHTGLQQCPPESNCAAD